MALYCSHTIRLKTMFASLEFCLLQVNKFFNISKPPCQLLLVCFNPQLLCHSGGYFKLTANLFAWWLRIFIFAFGTGCQLLLVCFNPQSLCHLGRYFELTANSFAWRLGIFIFAFSTGFGFETLGIIFFI